MTDFQDHELYFTTDSDELCKKLELAQISDPLRLAKARIMAARSILRLTLEHMGLSEEVARQAEKARSWKDINELVAKYEVSEASPALHAIDVSTWSAFNQLEKNPEKGDEIDTETRF